MAMQDTLSLSLAAKLNAWITDLIRRIIAQYFFLATVTAISSGTVQVQRQGQGAADGVYYATTPSALSHIQVGDPVICTHIGANFAVLEKLPMPATATAYITGFNGTPPIAKPTVTGSRGGNAALASVLTALANYGLITDSSS